MEEQVNIDYVKGFNEGYVMTAYEPGLADKIAKIESGAVRLEGFRDGRKELTLEQVKGHQPSWMKSPPTLPSTSKEHDKGHDPDR